MNPLAFLQAPPPSWVPCTALLHLLIVENRQIYTFYFSARSIISKVATAAELGDKAAQWENMADFSYSTLQADQDCIDQAIRRALWFDLSTDKCFHGVPWLLAAFHALTLAAVVPIVVASVMMLGRTGARDFSSPRYLVFTWHLEHTRAYHIMSRALVVYCIAVAGLALLMSTGALRGAEFRVGPFRLLKGCGAEVFLCVQSVLSHLRPQDPAFDWRSPMFLRTTWRRSLQALFTESNDAFATKIGEAILEAETDDVARLSGIAPDAFHAVGQMEQVRVRRAMRGPMRPLLPSQMVRCG